MNENLANRSMARPWRLTTLARPVAAASLLTLLPAQGAEALVSTTRTALEKWTEARRLASHEAGQWLVGKEATAARIDVVEREIAATRQRIADAQKSLADAQQKRGELEAAAAAQKSTFAALEVALQRIEQRVAQLLPRLPEPLLHKLEPFTQQIPRGEQASRLGVDARYANVIAVLNEVQKWNREITVASEVRPQPDGQSVEVTVVYLGLAQAYYVGAGGKVAGVGTASPAGWSWQARNELAPVVQRTIAILKNEQVAGYVRLPVQIQ